MDFKKYDEPPVKHMISMIYEDEIERLNVKIERLQASLDDMIQFVRKEYGSNDVRVQAAEAVLKEKE